MKTDDIFADSVAWTEKKSIGPVTCLGLTFQNDEARRAHFTDELRKKLQDLEFRKIEGFPIGSDEDILNLSDPPYYTACPNPWIADFIAEWETQKPEHPEGYHYHREPFAADVSEGKNDPIYNAHSYHTKVPHKAIMRYILHYTQPGDIVYDGFCGTGMTGVAAQLCGNREVVMSLGYQVKPDGAILREELDEDGRKVWKPFSKLGTRRTVLNDLSPAASFIAYNYNAPVNVSAFQIETKKILAEVENECSWMYETKHSDGRIGKINYTVWSDVFVCPECAHEIVFWEVAVDKSSGQVVDEFKCPNCSAHITKRNMDRAWETKYDAALQETISQVKQVPALINYSASGKRFEKRPDAFDIALIEKIESKEIPYWYPSIRMIDGKETRRNDPTGITHVHHFYTKRNLWALASFWNRIGLSELKPFLYQFFLGSLRILSKQAKHNKERRTENAGLGWINAGVTGTLYISSCPAEQSVLFFFSKKVSKLSSFGEDVTAFCLSNSSSTGVSVPDSCIDYVFLDPPFGSNLNYSELSFNWESWLNILTNNNAEAIENSVQGKGINEYRQLMTACFNEACRLLKPGRWMTVEFSNTKSSVWNSIQVALTEAGFIVASVSALDKKQGSFKAVTTPTAVKQDLVISAYKPNGGFEDRFQKEAQTEEGVWDFVRTHLNYLPVTKQQGALLQFVPERDPRILFDQMVAYYVRKGYPVPISSQEFQIGLAQRFIERDGMYFLPDQVAEYDRKKILSGDVQQDTLFVSDETSAIQWLRARLKLKPQQYNEIQPDFMPLLSHLNPNEKDLISLDLLLNQNFLCYEGKGPVPEQIHAYLSSNWKDLRNLPKDDPTLVAKARDRWYVPDPNKAGDLEKLREKALLKEFEEYKVAKKKLKVFRIEAVRAGFKYLWQQRTPQSYRVIIDVAEKIPSSVLEEDPKLLMWYDQAVTRMGDANEGMLL